MPTLRELRKREKLSQRELGELVGVGQRQIACYELGVNNPSPAVADRIRAAFDLTTDEMWEMLYRRSA